MVKVYESLIIKGEKTINDVPKKIMDDVKVALVADGYPDLADG